MSDLKKARDLALDTTGTGVLMLCVGMEQESSETDLVENY